MVVWKGSSETRLTINMAPHDISVTEALHCSVQVGYSIIYSNHPDYVSHFQLQKLINVFCLTIMWKYCVITTIFWEESISMSWLLIFYWFKTVVVFLCLLDFYFSNPQKAWMVVQTIQLYILIKTALHIFSLQIFMGPVNKAVKDVNCGRSIHMLNISLSLEYGLCWLMPVCSFTTIRPFFPLFVLLWVYILYAIGACHVGNGSREHHGSWMRTPVKELLLKQNVTPLFGQNVIWIIVCMKPLLK